MWYASAVALAVDACAARERVLTLLEDDHGRALGEHEAVTILVERTRRALRIVVAPAHRVHRRERADRAREDRRLSATGDHHVDLSAADHLAALTDGVRARRAR